MEIEKILTLAAGAGFPAVIATYLLVAFRRDLALLTAGVLELKAEIHALREGSKTRRLNREDVA